MRNILRSLLTFGFCFGVGLSTFNVAGALACDTQYCNDRCTDPNAC